MTNFNIPDDESLPPAMVLPPWAQTKRGQGLEALAFASGAGLANVERMFDRPGHCVPERLLRDRMAMRAAQSCLALEGRSNSEAEIRDAVCLVRPGDAMGPAGDMFMRWRDMSRIDLQRSDWRRTLGNVLPPAMAVDLIRLTADRDPSLPPVSRIADLVTALFAAFPREETAILIVGDTLLARALRWRYPIPMLGADVSRGDLRAREGLPETCHRLILAAASEILRLGSDLNRRAIRLNAVAPKLRTCGATEAADLFLSLDAVSPSTMLSPRIRGTAIQMTDRSARRFCDRLIELNVARELTGRSTFRLYGL